MGADYREDEEYIAGVSFQTRSGTESVESDMTHARTGLLSATAASGGDARTNGGKDARGVRLVDRRKDDYQGVDIGGSEYGSIA